MNGLLILFSLVNFIHSREITTISFADRHNLAEKGLADVFKNEGAFVRPEIKVFFYFLTRESLGNCWSTI